jgi:hypothetical protein
MSSELLLTENKNSKSRHFDDNLDVTSRERERLAEGDMRAILLVLGIAICTHLNAFSLTPHVGRAAVARLPSPSSRQSSRQSLSMGINEWLIKQGATDVKISISGQNNVITTGAIKKGESIISIPRQLALDVAKAEAKFKSVGLAAYKLRTGELGLLALLLISERAAGSSSVYAEYIKAFADVPPSGVLGWEAQEVDEFLSSTTRRFDTQLAAIDGDFESINSISAKLFPEIEFNKGLWRWAIGHVKAKAVYIDGPPALVPGIDSIEMDPLSMAEVTTL